MKEKIQQDLSKVGVKQEIIDETITFDRLYAMDDSDLPLDIGEIIGIFERIYEKDERNYVAAKKVLQFHGRDISYSIREDYDEKIKNAVVNEEVKEYSKNPLCNYEMQDPDVTRHEGNFICGDDITVYLKIQDDKVSEFSYDGNPSTVSLAAASFLSELII